MAVTALPSAMPSSSTASIVTATVLAWVASLPWLRVPPASGGTAACRVTAAALSGPAGASP